MIDRIDIVEDVDKFHKEYVARRKPCILSSIIGDLTCLKDLTDFDHLAESAGHARIAVEPISDKGTFGTAATKQEMTLKDFLKKLQAGEKVYLTTQYSEEEEDEVFNEPLSSLRKSLPIPLMPELGKSLVPAKINLWLGASTEGTSSGLHHDYHDNFYVLLAGQKQFRIFPPSWETCKKLQIHGHPFEIFDNGLISYYGKLCSDGLTTRTKAELWLAVCEQALAKAKAGGEDLTELEAAVGDAEDALLEVTLNDAVEDGEFEDGDDSDVESDDSKQDLSRDEDLQEDDNATNEEEADDGDQDSNLGHESDEHEPPSFSRLTTTEVAELLTQHGGLGHEFVLKAGELLYLPASYFHEVISKSAQDDFHMAVNYWFYPPDAPDGTYKDAKIMEEQKRRILQAHKGTTTPQLASADRPADKKVKV